MIKKIKTIKKNDKYIFRTWSPMFKGIPDGDMNEYRQYIFDRVKFSKVLHALKLRPEECSTARYTHRMICPFKFHKNGHERTGSFRISDSKNVFTCFGCNEAGDILKFLSLYSGGCEQYNLKKLASLAGLLDDTSIWIANDYTEQDNEANIKSVNYQTLFNVGLILRNYLNAIKDKNIYIVECEWVDQMFVKIDKYFDAIEQDSIEDAQKIYDSVDKSIVKRKSKMGNK
jgi:hypothetical protein